MNLLEGQIKPLLRIGLAFALAWFYHGLTETYLNGASQFLIVIILAFGTWMILMSTFFPASVDGEE